MKDDHVFSFFVTENNSGFKQLWGLAFLATTDAVSCLGLICKQKIERIGESVGLKI